jgi:pimeloyl-ACP methyl ester carboxylesterase
MAEIPPLILPATGGPLRGGIVFLHGDFGNLLRAPQRAWQGFADRHRWAVGCPSHRWGFWNASSVPVIEAAADLVASRLPTAAAPVLLAGHSDGGKGVTHAAARNPSRYAGLVYISGTLTDYTGLPFLSRTTTQREIADPDYASAWQGQRILIFQGDRDWSVRKVTADRAALDFEQRGADVTYRVYPGEGHLLFLRRKDEVFADLAAWAAAGFS